MFYSSFRRCGMAINYDKLFHMMIDRKITNIQLKDMAGVSANIITRLKRDEYISIESIDGKKLFIVGNFTTEEQTSSAQVPSGWSGYYNFVSGESIDNAAGTKPTVGSHDFIMYSNFLNNK